MNYSLLPATVHHTMATPSYPVFDCKACAGILNPNNPNQQPLIDSMFVRNEFLAIKFETSQWVVKGDKIRWRFVLVGDFGKLYETDLSATDAEGIWVREFSRGDRQLGTSLCEKTNYNKRSNLTHDFD